MHNPLLLAIGVLLICWSVIGIVFVIFQEWQSRRDRKADSPRWLRWDSTNDEVAEWGDVLAAVEEPPTEEFPAVEVEWEHTRESFAALVEDVRRGDSRWLRLRFALEYPTQGLPVVENFGVRRVREAHIHGRVIVGAPWAVSRA